MKAFTRGLIISSSVVCAGMIIYEYLLDDGAKTEIKNLKNTLINRANEVVDNIGTVIGYFSTEKELEYHQNKINDQWENL